MRTVIGLAIGFIIARQIYINYDKEQANQKEKALKNRLKRFLQDNGLTLREAEHEANKLITTR